MNVVTLFVDCSLMQNCYRDGLLNLQALSFPLLFSNMATRKAAITLFSSSTCSLCTKAKESILRVQKKVG
jgi:hypothetical protein